MQRVIFDSSFLMAVVEFPTTWYEDITDALGKFQPVLLQCVARELERISSGQGRRARYASLALTLASEFQVEECGGVGVDEEIVSKALTLTAAAATADRELLRSLRSSGVRVIGLRGGRVALL